MAFTQQLCIFDWFGYDLPLLKRYQLIKASGFHEVMLWWGDEFREAYGEKSDYPYMAQQVGLQVRNVHFSYYQTDQLWRENAAGDALAVQYRKWIQECAGLSIQTIVIHGSESGHPLPLSRVGLDRFKAFVYEAEKAGVSLAVENTKSIPHLGYLLDNIQSPFLGFCYDSGHSHLVQPGTDLLARYGHRLLALHLHDNHGKVDEHLLPGEGKIQWEPLIQIIKESPYQGPLSLEVAKPYPPKDQESAEAYLQRARLAAQGLLNLGHKNNPSL